MALRDELVNDPESRGYAEMTTEQILADLSERRYPADVVKVEEVTAYLDTQLLRPALRRLMENEQAAQQMHDIAETALGLSSSRYPYVELDVATPMAQAMVMAGVFTEEQGEALLNLANNKLNRLDVLGLPEPTLADLRVAMEEAGIWQA